MRNELEVRIEEIPESGREIDLKLTPEWLGDTLLDVYKASSPVQVALRLRVFGDNVYAEGRVQLQVTFEDSLTLEEGTKVLDFEMHELFVPANTHRVKLDGGVDGEIEGDEPSTFDGVTVNLEQALREAIVFAQDPYPRITEPDVDEEPKEPVWKDPADLGDPRWAKLRDVDLN
jgi:uncharacterized metal-binding protein YceD (DUF177 family)